MILIDEQNVEPTAKRDIYVYERGGDIWVKRISRVEGVGLLIESDNDAPDYPPDLVPMAEAHVIRPLGRVFWTCHDVR